jgi:hypothetical protein
MTPVCLKHGVMWPDLVDVSHYGVGFRPATFDHDLRQARAVHQ